MEGETILIALMIVVLSTGCFADNHLEKVNLYNRPDKIISRKEFLKIIRASQDVVVNENGWEIPVGGWKILNDDEVHSLLALVENDTAKFSFGNRPIDYLNIASYDERYPYDHCKASTFSYFTGLCEKAHSRKALANYCYKATKKQFQHCSEKGISHLFNAKMARESEKGEIPLGVSYEFSKYLEREKDSESQAEEDKVKGFMSSLDKALRDSYKEECNKLAGDIKKDLAYFFFNKNVKKFDYSAIEEPEPEYDRVWKLCKSINSLAARKR